MSYRLKLTITISLLIAIAFSIGGTLMIESSFHTSHKAERQAALHSFEFVQNTLHLLDRMDDSADTAQLSDALTQMEQQNMGRWQALRLKSSQGTIFQSGSAALLEYALPTPSSGQCSYAPISDQYGHGLLVLSQIGRHPDSLELLVRFDLSGVYQMREQQVRIYVMIYSAVVTFGVIASFALSGALTGSLRKLTRTVRQISGGDLSQRAGLTSHDEFGQLSRDFDIMADKLQETITQLETDMQRQERFMGAFAHELKTPMTSIIGFADLLRQNDLDERTRLSAANHIYMEGRRLEQLAFKLQELLLLDRDSFTMRNVMLPAFIAEVEQIMSPVLRAKGIRLVCKADQARACFEPDLVKSLLYNLIDNASKAIDGDGLVALSATALPGGCQFLVADNGRGMRDSELERITEAFYRVDKARSRSQGGAGLGLALCKQIAQLHGGELSFATKIGQGTRVTVTLYEKESDRHA